MRCDEYVQSDIQKLQTLSHPNIVGLVQVMSSRTRLYVISEYAAGGELYDALQEYEECRFPETIARFYFRQLVNGLAYCHRHNVYHGDLQGDNLLLDGMGNLKISRVGMKNVKHQQTDEELMHCQVGPPPYYLAPETLETSVGDDVKSDAWSIGVILFYLLTGKHPFDGLSTVGVCFKIMKASYEFPPWVSIEAQSCVSRLLTVDVTERASLEEIATHPWVMGGESYGSPDGAIFSPCVEPAPLLDFVRRQLSDSECGVPPPTEDIHSQRVLQIYVSRGRWLTVNFVISLICIFTTSRCFMDILILFVYLEMGS